MNILATIKDSLAGRKPERPEPTPQPSTHTSTERHADGTTVVHYDVEGWKHKDAKVPRPEGFTATGEPIRQHAVKEQTPFEKHFMAVPYFDLLGNPAFEIQRLEKREGLRGGSAFLAWLEKESGSALVKDSERVECKRIIDTVDIIRAKIVECGTDKANAAFKKQGHHFSATATDQSKPHDEGDLYTQEELHEEFKTRRNHLKREKLKFGPEFHALQSAVCKRIAKAGQDAAWKLDKAERTKAEEMGATFIPSGGLLACVQVGLGYFQPSPATLEPTRSGAVAQLMLEA